MNRVCLSLLVLLLLTAPGWARTIVIDDFSPDCRIEGTWADNKGNNAEGKNFSGSGCVNGDYHYTSMHGAQRKTGRERATWVPRLPQAGNYKVEITYRASENRSAKVTYEVVFAGGRKKFIVNQRESGKANLGVFPFDAGTSGQVVFVSDGGGSASIDSAQFTFVGTGGTSDGGSDNSTGLGDLIGGSPDTGAEAGALISLSDQNPGTKQVTLTRTGKLSASVCLRTYGPANLRVTVNGTPWITWSRADDKDPSPCEANGQPVAESIFMEKPGDPTAREVTLTLEANSGDTIEGSLEGGDGSFVRIRQEAGN